MTESDFDAKPSILLLGQYSTGKTTFIKYLLGRDYPGCHIGPEPTTDRFVVVYHGMDERRVPGNTLAVQKDLPYQGLAGFGTGFLSRWARLPGRPPTHSRCVCRAGWRKRMRARGSGEGEGNALAVQKDLPYSRLAGFGTVFLPPGQEGATHTTARLAQPPTQQARSHLVESSQSAPSPPLSPYMPSMMPSMKLNYT
eukprot:172709-Chlamydomonas_euryale.AAC.1